MANSSVSIIIPTYKRSDRIERAVKSALNQDYEDFEVIVVDDNNPKTEERIKTEKILSKYERNDKFKYIKHDKNMNGSVARNTGIWNAKGKYITFLDDDDEYYPNKISVQVESLETTDEIWGICYTAYEKIDQYNNIQKSKETAEGNVLVQALAKNLFIGSGSNFMLTKEVAKDLNGFDETFERNQDLEFLARVLQKYKMKYCDEVTFLIHNEIRETKRTFEELVLINKKYRDRFAPIILKLSKNDQLDVEKSLALWDIRYALSFGKYKEFLSIYRKSRLTLGDLSKYFYYLLYRYIKKESFGFKLK